jgi:hypothetical protein
MGHHGLVESRRVRVGSSFGYLAEVRTLTVFQIQSRQGRDHTSRERWSFQPDAAARAYVDLSRQPVPAAGLSGRQVDTELRDNRDGAWCDGRSTEVRRSSRDGSQAGAPEAWITSPDRRPECRGRGGPSLALWGEQCCTVISTRAL